MVADFFYFYKFVFFRHHGDHEMVRYVQYKMRAVSPLGQTSLLFAPSRVRAREASPNQPRRCSKGLGASIQVELILKLRF